MAKNKVQLCNLMVVIDKSGYISVKPWNKCTKKEKDSACQLDEVVMFAATEFNTDIPKQLINIVKIFDKAS